MAGMEQLYTCSDDDNQRMYAMTNMHTSSADQGVKAQVKGMAEVKWNDDSLCTDDIKTVEADRNDASSVGEIKT